MPPTPEVTERTPKPVLLGFPPPKSPTEAIFLVMLIAGSAALQPFVTPYVDAFWSFIGRTISRFVVNYPGRLFLLLVFVGAAYGLYRLKKSRQRLYGGLEIGFAVLTAWFVFEKLSSAISASEIIALVGAGYLLVRGLTNYSEGRGSLKAASLSAPSVIS